jgi:hypothetical protein
MTWKEIKQAVAEAGVSDDDEIGLIQCETQQGDHTLHKMRLGKTLKLSENISSEEALKDAGGCSV